MMNVQIAMFPATKVAVVEHHGPLQSGETLADYPVFFHYVNVGPEVQKHEMITDVYLPLKG